MLEQFTQIGDQAKVELQNVQDAEALETITLKKDPFFENI